MNKIFPSPYSDLSIHMLRNIHTKCIFITLPHTCWVGALYLLIVCQHKSTSYQLWILREIVLLLLPGHPAPLPQICPYTQTHTQPTDSSNCEGWVDGLSCWFRLKLFQHTKFFDPKLFLFCTCEYYISSIHSYHNMILIIPMQTDRQPAKHWGRTQF